MFSFNVLWLAKKRLVDFFYWLQGHVGRENMELGMTPLPLVSRLSGYSNDRHRFTVLLVLWKGCAQFHTRTCSCKLPRRS